MSTAQSISQYISSHQSRYDNKSSAKLASKSTKDMERTDAFMQSFYANIAKSTEFTNDKLANVINVNQKIKHETQSNRKRNEIDSWLTKVLDNVNTVPVHLNKPFNNEPLVCPKVSASLRGGISGRVNDEQNKNKTEDDLFAIALDKYCTPSPQKWVVE